MIDIVELPEELREWIWTEYRDGVRERLLSPILSAIFALCNDGASTVLDWMAHMLQHPNVKPGKAIVLMGSKGSGRGTFVEFLGLLLGRDKVVEMSRREFHGHLDGTTLIHLADANLRVDLPRIMELVTDDQILIAPIYQHAYDIPTYHRVIITTNALSPLLQHSTAFHEHFTVITCPTMDDPEFRNAVHDPARLAAFREHLMNRPVSRVM